MRPLLLMSLSQSLHLIVVVDELEDLQAALEAALSLLSLPAGPPGLILVYLLAAGDLPYVIYRTPGPHLVAQNTHLLEHSFLRVRDLKHSPAVIPGPDSGGGASGSAGAAIGKGGGTGGSSGKAGASTATGSTSPHEEAAVPS
ncbi:hypothetical protein EIP91_011268 [Steccherinum ochraceum]|uniref:Uncharacterized protein n=1 Tax=Steccherinum ochraceum TaxID=92696 RepID=A0A4R0R2C9_9APHY|nr:hypothetical protein EIP91_011268 [Steccherinum ochraceum]